MNLEDLNIEDLKKLNIGEIKSQSEELLKNLGFSDSDIKSAMGETKTKPNPILFDVLIVDEAKGMERTGRMILKSKDMVDGFAELSPDCTEVYLTNGTSFVTPLSYEQITDQFGWTKF